MLLFILKAKQTTWLNFVFDLKLKLTPYYTMLYFFNAFIALTAIQQWNPLISSPATIHSLDKPYPFINLHHKNYYPSIATSKYDAISNLGQTLDFNLTDSLWTHNAGCKTHSTVVGHMTQDTSYALYQCRYFLITGYMTCWHQNIMSMSMPIHKWHTNFQFGQKACKHCKSSPMSLLLAINRSIYYLLNGSFNRADDVNHLTNRLLLILRQYMTQGNDFKHFWFTLLLSGLLRSQHISSWFIFILVLRIHVMWSLFGFQKKKNHLMIVKIVMLCSYLHYIYMCVCMCLSIRFKFLSLYNRSHLPQKLKSTTGFIGSGRPARTEYEFLKPYVVSIEVQSKNPHEFSYLYSSHHSTIADAMKEIQTSGEAQLVCSIPLSLVANILTTIQADEVAKKHNLHALSRKSVAEKRKAIESHVCTMSCNKCVTIFRPVKKNLKSIPHQQHQHYTKGKEIKNHAKVGKKSWKKPVRAITNHKYYVRENVKFPPFPPSKRLMHKIISGFCNDTHPSKFEETGCAVCGQLVVMSKLIKLTDVKCSLDPLVRIGVTRVPRNSMDDPIKEINGPIIDENCKHVCLECISFLEKKVMPPMALANGLWVGNVPKELSDLTFVERLLVSRV